MGLDNQRWSDQEAGARDEFEAVYRSTDSDEARLIAAAITLAGLRIAAALDRVEYQLDQLRGA